MRPRIAILGGGIGGLSLAFFLKRELADRVDIVLLEKSHRVGGLIESHHQAGFIFEQGPRSCRRDASSETLEIVEALGLQQQLVYGSPVARRRFLYLDKRLTALPNSPSDWFSPLGRKILYGGINDVFTRKIDGDVSVYEFFRRRFSPFAADVLADALVSGIYAGDSKQLSMKAAFKNIYAFQKQYGSVVRGMLLGASKTRRTEKGVFSFFGGMETLVYALRDHNANAIRYHQDVLKLVFHDEKIIIHTSTESIDADHVFSCLPAHALLKTLGDKDELRSLLTNFSSTSIAVVNLAYQSTVIDNPGFGYLIPKNQKQENLGVVFDSSVFPHVCAKGHSLLSVMIGGAHRDISNMQEEELVIEAKAALLRQINIKLMPHLVNVKIIRDAIPQYHLGHEERLSCMKKITPSRLHIMGGSFFGVSINDIIRNAKEAALEFCSSQEKA